jgi:hypothetical protein
VFVKIPKVDLRRRGGTILPISVDDRRMAQDEYDSLLFLADRWRADDLRVSFVRPLGFFEPCNAIVLAHVRARDACETLRRWDLRRRVGDRGASRRTQDVMARMGLALRRLHDGTAQPSTFRGGALQDKLVRYIERLDPIVADRRVLSSARDAAMRIGQMSQAVECTSTLKGIDIRNVMLDGDDGIVLFDPGKRKITLPEADLARFLVTYRILWWGHPAFLFGCRADPRAEDAFLHAYEGRGSVRGPLFHAQMVKELLKHWATAHESLRLKAWPPVVSRVLAAGWIDRFYASQLRHEVRHVV